MKKSETLEGYSVFVEKVRECEKKLPLEEAMKIAVKYCIEHDILKQFLTMQSSEVFKTEWNLDEAKEAWFEEGLEEGLERGREEIAHNALAKGVSVELIHEITGLDMETIKNIKAGK